MAIAAKFDLETLQLDAINAFTHSEINEVIYVECPPGYRQQGFCYKLLRALYGLRRSPQLWQRDLAKGMQSLGLQQVTKDLCVFTSKWLIVFFYVDDIALLFRKRYKDQVR